MPQTDRPVLDYFGDYKNRARVKEFRSDSGAGCAGVYEPKDRYERFLLDWFSFFAYQIYLISSN